MQQSCQISEILVENGLIQPPLGTDGRLNLGRADLFTDQQADNVSGGKLDADKAQRHRRPQDQYARADAAENLKRQAAPPPETPAAEKGRRCLAQGCHIVSAHAVQSHFVSVVSRS